MRQCCHVFTLFEQNTSGIKDDFGVHHQRIQRDQGFRPFDAFGNARRALKGIAKRRAAQSVDKVGHLGRQQFAGLWHLRPHNCQLAVAVRVVDRSLRQVD